MERGNKDELREEIKRQTPTAAQSSNAPEHPTEPTKRKKYREAMQPASPEEDLKDLHQRVINLLEDMRYNAPNSATLAEIDKALTEDLARRAAAGKILSNSQDERDLLNAIKMPVNDNSATISAPSIGNWESSIGQSAKGPSNDVVHHSSAPVAKDTPSSPSDIINNIEVAYAFVTRDEYIDADPIFFGGSETNTELDSKYVETITFSDTQKLAHYRQSTQQIVLYEYSEDIKEDFKDQNDQRAEFIKGNKYAQQQVYYHELTHAMHHQYDGDDESNLSLVNTARTRNLTERTARAVEYLNATETYLSLKKQGIKEVDAYGTGEMLPIEHILEMNEGLKEIVLRDNFDLNDKQCLRDIASAAMKSWNEEVKESYDKVIKDIAAENAPENRGFTAMKSYYTDIKQDDNVYQIVSDRMLKDVLISENTFVDLTCCKDILDDMSISNAYSLTHCPTPEEMNAIDAHLEKKGLKTDEEKESYLANYFEETTNRTGNADAELTEILLSYNNKITYADNLAVMKNKDKYILWDQEKDAYLALSKEEFYALTNKKEPNQNNQSNLLAAHYAQSLGR